MALKSIFHRILNCLQLLCIANKWCKNKFQLSPTAATCSLRLKASKSRGFSLRLTSRPKDFKFSCHIECAIAKCINLKQLGWKIQVTKLSMGCFKIPYTCPIPMGRVRILTDTWMVDFHGWYGIYYTPWDFRRLLLYSKLSRTKNMVLLRMFN